MRSLKSASTLAATVFVLAGCNEFTVASQSTVEVYSQSPWEDVDILLVVDNSCSMEPYQEKLANDFGGFFDFFANGEVNWRLAVIHTDGYANDLGTIRSEVVTSDTPNPAEVFAEIVHVGTGGGGVEVGLEAAARALNGYNDGFPREDASTSVIFVSDEQDSSPGSIPDYVNGFYNIHGHRSREAFNASALTVTELADCPPEQFTISSAGTRYIETARLTGGITANLCLDDFEGIVQDLALTTSAMLDSFYLLRRPDLNTLKVIVDGEDLPCESGAWTYLLLDRDGTPTPAVKFAADSIPAPSADIVFEYEHGTGNVEDFCTP